MKILLISIGTRGDIEPFLAQGEKLKGLGHEVICLFPEQFRELVERLNVEFRGLDKRFLEMLDSSVGKSVMGGGGNLISKAKNFFSLVKTSFSMQSKLILQQKNAIEELDPDRVFFHPKAMYCSLASMAFPEKYFLLCPIPCVLHPHRDFPHLGLSKWDSFPKQWNVPSYGFVNWFRYKTFNRFLKMHFRDFPELDFSISKLRKFELTQLQTLYQISPTLFPKPDYWPKSAQVTGYFFRNQGKNYQPDPSLLDWLAKYPKAILLTFGSMTNPKPGKISQEIIDLLEKHEIPAIVNLSWGGLEKVENTSERIYFVNQIPYDWILPKLYGMIHHGGSGTTHQGARAGNVQLIIPHIMDQYFWNKLIFNKGIGPKGISIHNFDLRKFESLLIDFWANPEYKKVALQIAKKISKESNSGDLLNLMQHEN
ncbi:MAG: glycosyltransferase [Cyclobacteriaceae bacterium]|nr:glycosyltransferase [Cyclobacteriaceae bacterium]MDX5466116.1 glycosyltransferase [Cyclobacteriaceae bacterium]